VKTGTGLNRQGGIRWGYKMERRRELGVNGGEIGGEIGGNRMEARGARGGREVGHSMQAPQGPPQMMPAGVNPPETITSVHDR